MGFRALMVIVYLDLYVGVDGAVTGGGVGDTSQSYDGSLYWVC